MSTQFFNQIGKISHNIEPPIQLVLICLKVVKNNAYKTRIQDENNIVERNLSKNIKQQITTS